MLLMAKKYWSVFQYWSSNGVRITLVAKEEGKMKC